MRKPVCLAVLGISVVVAAVSLGVTLTRYLGLRSYSPKGTTRAAAPPAGRIDPAAPAEEWNNVFAPGDGMKMASRLPASNAKGASQAPRSAFVLVGTIVSSTPSARRAILWTSGMKEPKAFREKAEVEPGAFLSSVERDRVWITRGKERENLEILPVGSRNSPGGAGPPAAVPVAASPIPPPGLSPGMPSRSGTAASPDPSPDRAMGPVTAPKVSSGDEEEDLRPQVRRGRLRSPRR